MAVTDIKPLRKVDAEAGVESIEVTVEFRVTCNTLYDGPAVILSQFPLGRIMGSYNENLESEDRSAAPHKYHYPWPTQWCSNPAVSWSSPESGMGSWDTPLFISNVRIVEREKIDRYNETVNWIVEVTFSRDSIHGPGYSIREITPYYIYDDEPQEYGAMVGLYNRIISTRKPSDGPSQPGEWKRINDYRTIETVFKGKFTDPDEDVWRPMAFCNTVGEPLPAGEITQRKARPAYKCEWFSYTALDFADAVGKVNAAPYTLVSWDSSWQWPTNSFYGTGVDSPAVIFYRCFNPRELLVHAVDCEIVNWSGRKCYRYSVDLIYDRDGHDIYVANTGFASRGITGDDTASGGKLESDDVQDSMSPMQLIKGVDGTGPSEPQYIGIDGKPLIKHDVNNETYRTTDDAVFMRWRIHEEVDFYNPWQTTDPDSGDTNFQFEVAAVYQTGSSAENSKCPLFYDGGWRYQQVSRIKDLVVPDSTTWPEGVCREPEPENTETRHKKKDSGAQ